MSERQPLFCGYPRWRGEGREKKKKKWKKNPAQLIFQMLFSLHWLYNMIDKVEEWAEVRAPGCQLLTAWRNFLCVCVCAWRTKVVFVSWKTSDTLQRIPNLKQCKMLHQTCFTVLTLLPVKSTPVTVSETFWIISWLCFTCCWAESSWKTG